MLKILLLLISFLSIGALMYYLLIKYYLLDRIEGIQEYLGLKSRPLNIPSRRHIILAYLKLKNAYKASEECDSQSATDTLNKCKAEIDKINKALEKLDCVVST